MANHSISNNQLRPDATIWVRGHLTYSRVTKQIAGAELQADIQRKRQNNRIPIEKPYTTATICDAQVLFQNPQAPTIEEKFIEERLYTSTKNPGYNYTAVNKGNKLPYIGYLEGNQFRQIAPEGELDNGLDVTLIIRVFKGNPQNGTTLDAIILNEPVRYYSSSGLGLAERGIVLVSVPGYDNSAAAHAGDNTVAAPEADTLGTPAQTPIAQTPVNSNPYSSAPQASAPVGSYNPAAAQAPQPVAQPQANMYNPAQATPAPTPTNIPAGQSGGIRYNPADRQY
jgi:hypothetical protein